MPMFGTIIKRLSGQTIKVQPAPGADTNQDALDYMQGPSGRSSLRPPGNGASGVTGGGSRRSCEIMTEHMNEREQDRCAKKEGGQRVTRKLAVEGLQVVRGPDWKWKEEDGGPGNPGTLLAANKNGTVTVHWHATQKVENHYRIKKAFDLCEVVGEQNVQPVRTSMFTGLMKGGAGGKVRNSQGAFADKSQTIIVFDWDDTLFPSTFIRSDLNLSLRLHLDKQRIPADLKEEVRHFLEKCCDNAQQLLRLAHSHSRVVIVTLARSPWVTNSCNYFYPGMDQVIKSLGIPIVYAQEGQQVDYDKVKMMSEDGFEAFYAGMKGRAISTQVKEFYSQYEGQTWKNVISIGDSSFERLGTLAATKEYLKELGASVLETTQGGKKERKVFVTEESRVVSSGPDHDSAPVNGANMRGSEVNVHGHILHVRTKVFKMIDEPTVEELITQLEIIKTWMLKMVRFPNSFDLDLKALDNKEDIRAIEAALRKHN